MLYTVLFQLPATEWIINVRDIIHMQFIVYVHVEAVDMQLFC